MLTISILTVGRKPSFGLIHRSFLYDVFFAVLLLRPTCKTISILAVGDKPSFGLNHRSFLSDDVFFCCPSVLFVFLAVYFFQKYLFQNEFKSELPCIANCMVIGDKRKFLTILIALRSEVSVLSVVLSICFFVDA